ncbi:MAG: hypothetical protein IPN01_28605 [Deltaproteobacteria bacterium]|nr:hypothetical protein [Deltaproteobacteria bacterium]
MELRRLDPRVIWLWRAQAMSRMFFFWGPICVGLGVLAAQGSDWRVGVLIGASLALMLLVLSLLWPALDFDRFGFELREHDLLVQRGVLFAAARPSPAPHPARRHPPGPIRRMFGLSTVADYTPRGMSADGSIPGLPTAGAEAIRDELARRGETMASNRAPPDDADDERTEVLRGGLLEALEFERTEHLREGQGEGQHEGQLESSGLFSLDPPTEERPRQPAGPHPDDETVMSPAAPRPGPWTRAHRRPAASTWLPQQRLPPPPRPAADTPWRGLHPASLLVNLIPRTWASSSGTGRCSWPGCLAAGPWRRALKTRCS